MSTAPEKIFISFVKLNACLPKYRPSNPVHKNASTSVLIFAEGPNPAARAEDERQRSRPKHQPQGSNLGTLMAEPAQNRHRPNRTKPATGIAAHAKKPSRSEKTPKPRSQQARTRERSYKPTKNTCKAQFSLLCSKNSASCSEIGEVIRDQVSTLEKGGSDLTRNYVVINPEDARGSRMAIGHCWSAAILGYAAPSVRRFL